MNKKTKYLGYQELDYKFEFAQFFNEKIEQIPSLVEQGLKQKLNNRMLSIQDATQLHNEGYLNFENGYFLDEDGSIQVSVLTQMPNVSPLMWDWWFGWHGSQDNRYKLWHPKAHVSAVWKDGREDIQNYIGRTSIIEEYIGSKLEKAAIQFISPSELGFTSNQIADKNSVVYICARIGYADILLDFGYLVHQIRATENGSEMRSRFWLGGEHIAFRSENFLAKIASKIIRKFRKLPEQQAKDLMQHCSEEMNHLAKFLPDLYSSLLK